MVRNVRFENIRIEDFRHYQLVNLRIFFNKKYCAAPGRGIENVLFKDITYNGENAELSIIAGYNEERKVKNIRFENLRINGEAYLRRHAGQTEMVQDGRHGTLLHRRTCGRGDIYQMMCLLSAGSKDSVKP